MAIAQKVSAVGDVSFNKGAIVVVALAVIGAAVSTFSSPVVGLLSMLGVALVGWIGYSNRDISERLDQYNVPGGWRSLIGKD